jgi:hypothetical protein
VALGNSRQVGFLPLLSELLASDEPVVRCHAAWAICKLDFERGGRLLGDRIKLETDERTRAALSSILCEYSNEPSTSLTSKRENPGTVY